ncbi:hypothetical protein [Chelativorans xinjiangense]|uniref:hypothetical protein n=1 Tax=Chelativorans xinjiangense TaxID=2681485 RepID=UPI00135C70C0|nr:hypothetical protein [Chelativorans xinjiangense]
MFWTAAYRANRSAPPRRMGAFVALFALIFSVAITVQSFPAENIEHALTVTVSHTADAIGSQSGPLDTKDDCGTSIHCHHAPAVLPHAFVLGASVEDNQTAPANEHGAFRLVRIPVPPPRLV